MPSTRCGASCTAGWWWSSAGPTPRAVRSSTAPGSSRFERFGLLSLDDLPLLDADVAERLVTPEPGAAGAPGGELGAADASGGEPGGDPELHPGPDGDAGAAARP